MTPGYAGVDNPLFVEPKTEMLFGDAKASILAVTDELKQLVGSSSASGSSADADAWHGARDQVGARAESRGEPLPWLRVGADGAYQL